MVFNFNTSHTESVSGLFIFYRIWYNLYMSNSCLHCHKEIAPENFFCYPHWLLLDGHLRGPLLSSKKPETLKKNIQKALDCLQEKEEKLNPFKKPLLYYAHPMGFYNTKREEESLACLQKYFPNYEIINPNSPEHSGKNMKYYLNLVRLSSVVVVEAFNEYILGAGVYSEAEVATWSNIPLKILKDKEVLDLDLKQCHRLSIEDTVNFNRSYKQNKPIKHLTDVKFDKFFLVESQKLYEFIKENSTLSFFGVKKNRLIWEAKAKDLELTLEYSGYNLGELEFNINDPVLFPSWETLEESGFSSIKIIDSARNLRYQWSLRSNN